MSLVFGSRTSGKFKSEAHDLHKEFIRNGVVKTPKFRGVLRGIRRVGLDSSFSSWEFEP